MTASSAGMCMGIKVKYRCKDGLRPRPTLSERKYGREENGKMISLVQMLRKYARFTS